MKIERLAEILVAREIELAMVCDHDSYEGAMALRSLLRSRHLAIAVPIAAEVRTDRGDIVVVFEEDDNLPAIDRLRDSAILPEIVAECRGMVWLPHPFRGHPEFGDLPSQSDVIEVFNSRCSHEKNQRGMELCQEVGAVAGFGSDAHLSTEVDRVIAEYEPSGTVLETLKGTPACAAPSRTPKSNVMAAEVINGVKARRPALVGYFAARYLKHKAVEWTRGIESEL